MGFKNVVRKPPNLLISVGLLAIWFGSSVCSTLVNKQLMDNFPYAVTLSAVHMLSAAFVDFVIVWSRGLKLTFRRDVLIGCLPVASAINFGKIMTYVSYGLVPASLTHTAKASSPVFTVIVSKILFNQVPTMATCVSLIPITVGVTLSALTEINWVFLGFIAAVAASLANVLNSTYTKKNLHHANAADPLIFHMYTACVAVTMLLPYAILFEMPTIRLFGDHNEVLAPTDGSTTTVDGASITPTAPTSHLFPWRAMILSVGLHYAQNISNIYFLNGVSVLTHQVAQSLKRLLNIAGAVLYFGNPVAPLNAAGMGLALIGFSMYSAAKNRPTTGKHHHRERTSSNTSLNTPSSSAALRLASPTVNGNGIGNALNSSVNDNSVAMQRIAKGPAGLTSLSPTVSILVEALQQSNHDSLSDSGGSSVGGSGGETPVQYRQTTSHFHQPGHGSWPSIDTNRYMPSSTLNDMSGPSLHPTAHAQHLHHQAMTAAAAAAAATPIAARNNHTAHRGDESPSPSAEEDNFCV